jgi:hypothetical protein
MDCVGEWGKIYQVFFKNINVHSFGDIHHEGSGFSRWPGDDEGIDILGQSLNQFRNEHGFTDAFIPAY